MNYSYSEYSQAVLNAGGAPVIIPAEQDRASLERILAAAQGIILSGGPDLNPRSYGEEPLPGLGEVDEALDRMELAAARLAIETDIPLLAICRGIQVLNVALGGSLYQDIPTQRPESICHNPKADKGVNTHRVLIEKGCRLRQMMGKSAIWVNSKHHQAIKGLGAGLVPAARASDGVLEAVELPAKRFVLGVQWHPEGTWRDDPWSKKIFQAFVHAAGATR
jgi:putative glutamine amidotransferase